MLATIRSLGLTGIEPFAVTAEVSVSQAMPGFDIVGRQTKFPALPHRAA